MEEYIVILTALGKCWHLYWMFDYILSSIKKYQTILQKSFVSYGGGKSFEMKSGKIVETNWNKILEITGFPYLVFNGIFGMAKGSNFLKFALDTIKLNYEKTPNYAARWVPGKTGPVFFTSIFVSVIHRQLPVFCNFHLFVAYFNISLFISIYSSSISTYFIPISTYSCTLTLIFLSNFHPFLVYFHPFHANI